MNMTKSNNSKKAPVRTLKLEPHQIVLRPMITEKAVYQSESLGHYAFEVNPHANKTEIKQAIEQLFGVEVDRIATQNRKGRARRFKTRVGQTKAVKRAIVRLKGDNRINFV